jgi:hypothetical protein
MAWQDEMVPVFRHMIGDVGATPQYTDDRLQNQIVSAGYFVQTNVKLSRVYVHDLVTPDITPDPTVNPRDEAYINLVLLKAACMFYAGEAKVQSRKALSMRDGPSAIDGRGVVQCIKDLKDDFCKAYEDAKLEYQMGKLSPGAAIVTPYRVNTADTQISNRHRHFFS